MARRELALLTCLAVAGALGCSTTVGSSWVSQPEPGPFAGDDVALTTEHGFDETFPPRAALDAPADGEGDGRARPRLDRTITLGETVVGAPERSEPARSSEAAPVHITINNIVTAPARDDAYPVAPLVAGHVRDGGNRTRRVRPAPLPKAPGQDWQAPPSFGPRFPFKTAPASPWQ